MCIRDRFCPGRTCNEPQGEVKRCVLASESAGGPATTELLPDPPARAAAGLAAGWRPPSSWARRRPARRRGAPRSGNRAASGNDELQMRRRLAAPSPRPGCAGGQPQLGCSL
eukprot:1974549-Alexandrium_andersonii.AAC.1